MTVLPARHSALFVALALTLAACVAPTQTPITSVEKKPPGITKSPGSNSGEVSTKGDPSSGPIAGIPLDSGPSAPGVALTTLSGLVTAPATMVAAGGLNLIGNDGNTLVAAGGGNMVAAGGGNIVAAGGGNIVAAGGGNIVAAGGGNYKLAQATDLPVTRARVYLMIGDRRLPIAPVETNERGEYAFPQVPTGVTYQVAVSIVTPAGKTGRMTTLATAGESDAGITPATTMLSAAIVGNKHSFGQIDAATFKSVATSMAKVIENSTSLTVDLEKPANMGAVATTALAEPDIKALLTALTTQISTKPRDADAISALVQAVQGECAVPQPVGPSPGASAWPTGFSALAIDADGTLYVAAPGDPRLFVTQPGQPGTYEPLDAPALALHVDQTGTVWLADAEGSLKRRDKGVTGPFTTAMPNDTLKEPLGIAVVAGVAYVADASAHTIVKFDGKIATTIGEGKPGAVDSGTGKVRFYKPSGIVAVDGMLYVADAGNRRIRKIDVSTAEPTVTTLAGKVTGDVDAAGEDARFGYPAAIAAGPDGTLWVADAGNRAVRRVTRAGAVDTAFAGSCGFHAAGIGFAGGLAFGQGSLWLIDGDSVVRRPLPSSAPSASPSSSPSPSPSPSATPTASPSPTPTPEL